MKIVGIYDLRYTIYDFKVLFIDSQEFLVIFENLLLNLFLIPNFVLWLLKVPV
jgi:hypothetical protein